MISKFRARPVMSAGHESLFGVSFCIDEHGGHGHIFCSALQFRTWCARFVAEVDELLIHNLRLESKKL